MGIFENIKRAICGEPEEQPTLTPDQQTALDAAQALADEYGFTLISDQAQVANWLDHLAEQGQALRKQKGQS